jgi:hypothetical protein
MDAEASTGQRGLVTAPKIKKAYRDLAYYFYEKATSNGD